MAISNDQTKEERLERKELIMFKNKLNVEGERNIKIKGNKLWFDNTEYSLENLRTLEEESKSKEKQHLDSTSKMSPADKTKPKPQPGTKRQLNEGLQKDSLISRFLTTPTIKRVKADK